MSDFCFNAIHCDRIVTCE